MQNARNGLLLDQIDRQIIIEFYKKSESKSKLWIWWHKNVIVSRYEGLKSSRELDRSYNIMMTEIIKSSYFKAISKLDKWLYSHFIRARKLTF